MKITFKPQQPKDFPKLMIAEDGTIILFFSPGEGTVLRQNCKFSTSTYPPGSYSGGWLMSNFTDYKGTVEFSN